MIQILRKIWHLLDTKERYAFISTLSLLLIASLVESFSVFIIYPFMQLMIKQDHLNNNDIISRINDLFNINLYEISFMSLGIALVIFSFLSYGIILLSKWIQYKYVWMSIYSFHLKTLNRYLSNSYEFFLTRDMSELSKNLLTEVQVFVGGLLSPFMELISKIFTVLLVLTSLMIINPQITAMSILLVGGVYVVISMAFQKKVIRLGATRLSSHETLYKGAMQIFGSIKELKSRNMEEVFIPLVKTPSKIYAKTNLRVQFLTIAPRYVLELVVIITFVIYMIISTSTSDGLMQKMPLMSLFAFAAIKILPYIQSIYASRTKVKYNAISLDKLGGDLQKYSANKDIKNIINADGAQNNNREIKFENILAMEGVSYIYPKSDAVTLQNISIAIKSNSFVGIIGETGSGKTTVLDILMGLLIPSSGHLVIDGKRIDKHSLNSLRNIISYIPQETFIFDDTLYNNITMKINSKHVNENEDIKYINAIEISQLKKYKEGKTKGFKLGERGSRLSGGEKQRIGIARALYGDRQIIILDESTSALDSFTEKKILDRLSDMKNLTTICITHKVSLLDKCDYLYVIKNGSIYEKGTFDELKVNSKFVKQIYRRENEKNI
jgi:ATP-binding cassette, subfamily B, bacterial PglK